MDADSAAFDAISGIVSPMWPWPPTVLNIKNKTNLQNYHPPSLSYMFLPLHRSLSVYDCYDFTQSVIICLLFEMHKFSIFGSWVFFRLVSPTREPWPDPDQEPWIGRTSSRCRVPGSGRVQKCLTLMDTGSLMGLAWLVFSTWNLHVSTNSISN